MSKIKYIIFGLLAGWTLPFFILLISHDLEIDSTKIGITFLVGLIFQFLLNKIDFEKQIQKIILYWVFFITGTVICFYMTSNISLPIGG